MSNKKKVLIIDDSALMRELLTDIINSEENFQVIATAENAIIGAEKVMKLNPDIVTLDIEMPRMDGLTFLEKLMKIHPKPVLIISSLAQHNSEVALKALELGALDYICKPRKQLTESLPALQSELSEKLQLCCISKLNLSLQPRTQIEKNFSTVSTGVKKTVGSNSKDSEKIIVIGASTGGTLALAKLFRDCPANLPGIVVVQHMPYGFTNAFANRLNNESPLSVKEASDNDPIIAGQVLISPGDKHLLVDRSGDRLIVRTSVKPPVKYHRPSVDVLFRSAALTVGKNVIAIILTGMGDDGTDGMLELKQKGAHNIAQDEASCTVYGMPRVAKEKGAVDVVLPLEQMAKYLSKYARNGSL